MPDVSNITLRVGGDPLYVLAKAGITEANGYGYRQNDDGTWTISGRADQLSVLVDIIDNYDAHFLADRLKPAAENRAWELRRLNQARMKVGGQFMLLDDTTLDRLTQADRLIDKAAERGEPLDVIKWEITKGTFVIWPVQQVQDTAFAAGMHVQQTFSHQCGLYEAIRACATAAELAAIDLESGWPNQ